MREIAWKKQRAELVKKGADIDRVAAASLAQSCAVNGHSSVVIGGEFKCGERRARSARPTWPAAGVWACVL